jgi:endonuclease/exonuclease/phosphatase family metal-dependent hydrolase
LLGDAVMTLRKAVPLLALVALPRCAPASEEEHALRSSLSGSYQGCYTDSAARALPVFLGNGYDTQRCIDAARARGLAYAGLQYYGECWGGTAVGYERRTDTECNTPCSAAPSEMCGGGWRNSIYATSPAPTGYLGCFTDDAARALPVFLGGGFDVPRCIEAARTRGLAVAGLQYYGECWGGSAAGYAPAPESECNTACSANPAQMCGGGWRNSIYATNATPPPSTTARIKLVSWNTANAQDPSGQTAVLGPLNADVVFLQESGGSGASYASGMNAYERSVASGKTWTISSDGSLMTWHALASGYEIRDIGQNSWPDNYDWTYNPHRLAVRAAIDFNGITVTFFATHLDWNPNRDMTNHIENRTKLVSWLDTFSGRKVFGGDINAWTEGGPTWEGNEQRTTISQLESRGTDGCIELYDRATCNGMSTNGGWVPDHVYHTAGVRTLGYRVITQASLSDHGLLVYELEAQ